MPVQWILDDLRQLADRDRLRERRPSPYRQGPYLTFPDGTRRLDLCSNDYLGLGALPQPGVSTPTSSAASRLVSGDLDHHASLEAALCDWLQTDAALLFTSGYAANVGALQALSGPDTLILSDELNHASIIDGCRLGRGRVVVTPHRRIESVERALREAPERRRIVVTDGLFSMDGDVAPLADLRRLCDAHDALLFVDEAHALGVLGPEGRGASAAAGVRPDILVGTLGKALGAGGAFVAGGRELHDWLWNRARSFVFSTGLAPSLAATAQLQLPQVRDGVRTALLQQTARTFRTQLASVGVEVLRDSCGPILPILLGAEGRALEAARRLGQAGYHVHPIRPPTVPRGTSRLRLTVRADLDPEILPAIADAVRTALHP
ncbi:MAG: 8-amino-7-oxononanoate synthase [Myxococcales bacterium]|nr:8-amino-7-oxononanoate synthase [Myxococcales bacterium]